MAIGWFPGHMAAARKEAAKTLAEVDVVIELLDARLPGASTNPMIETLRLHRQRPCVKVLNKADLADPSATAEWLKALGAEAGVTAVAVSCKSVASARRIPGIAAGLVPHRDSKLKPVRILVMGIPNVGKSTFVNALLKRHAAATGDQPAITKHQSRYQLDPRTELIDMPGLMWPKIAHASDGLMLAASHAIGPNAYVEEEVAEFLAGVLKERYPALVAARYGEAVPSLDAPGVIEAIARKRGFRLKGGDLDYRKGALTLLADYRSGTLGRVSLETPQSRAAMISAASPPADVEMKARRPSLG